MRKVKVLARSLAVVETLGSVNVVCSDKTGTLTANRMFARTLGVFGLTSSPQDAIGHINLGSPVGNAFKQLQFVTAVCNAATFDKADEKLPLNERRIYGDATDSAILRVAEEIHGLSKAQEGWEKRYQLPFNSKVSHVPFPMIEVFSSHFYPTFPTLHRTSSCSSSSRTPTVWN